MSEGGLLLVAARRLCYPGEDDPDLYQVGYPGEPFDPSERKRALIPRKYQGRRFLGVFACGLRTRSKDQDNLLPRQTRHLPIAKDFRSGSKSSKAHSSKEGHSKGGS